jgi:hypothetical protein
MRMAEDTMRKLLFAVAALAACADNSSPAPGDDGTGGDSGGGGGSGSGSGSGSDTGGVSTADRLQDYNDVAASLGANLSVGELAAMVDSVNMAYGRLPAGFTVTDGPDYQILDGTRGGLTIQYKLYCRDDLDAFTVCNGLENHAHVHPTYSGTVASANASMAGIQRTASWIVRDLALPNARIGGSGSDSFESSFSTGTYKFTVTDIVDHVLFAPTPTDPMGGGIDLTLTVQRDRPSSDPANRTFDVIANIAFTGTDTATITLDTSEVFDLTLSTGAIVRK